MKELLIKDIADRYIRENFTRIQEEIRLQKILQGEWQFAEITVPAATTGFIYVHSLGFKPTDVIQTAFLGTGSVVWNYGDFTTETLSLTTTGPGVIRAFIGAFRET